MKNESHEIDKYKHDALLSAVCAAMVHKRETEDSRTEYTTLIKKLTDYSNTLPWKTRRKALERLEYFEQARIDRVIKIVDLIEQDIFSDEILVDIVSKEHRDLILSIHESFGLKRPDRLELDKKAALEYVKGLKRTVGY